MTAPSPTVKLVALLLAFVGHTGCAQPSEKSAASPPQNHASSAAPLATKTAAPKDRDAPHYEHLFGIPYRTKVDLYLFVIHGDMDYVYLGRSDNRTGLRATPLPKEVRPDNIGKTYGDITLLDFIPAGSTYVIGGESHETIDLSGVRNHGGIAMGLVGRLSYGGKLANAVLAEFIQTAEYAPRDVANQRIDDSIAAPLSP